jgi:uncharacterized protein (DUF3820 family)
MKLHDDSIMPFGKWKGKNLGEVPGHYWRGLLDQEWCDKWLDLVEYANIVAED